jgi:ABC-type transport system substrate-binding protein
MKKILIFALVIIISLVFSACNKTGSDKASGTVSDGEPLLGGVLSIALEGEPTTLNAWRIRNSIDTFVGMFMYETLMVYDEDGRPQPYLIDSLSSDPKAKTYTMKVKEGITFQDGSPVNGESVAWNINFYKENGVLTSSFYSSVISAEVTGEYEVVVHMSEFDSLFPYTLARTCYLMSQKAYEENGEEGIAENPVGTGVFIVTKWDHGVGITLKAYENYWQGKPNLSGINLVVYSEILVAQASLLSGELNGLRSDTDYSIADDMKGNGFSVYTSTIPRSAYTICYNAQADSPFKDLRVRQAVSYAIDSKSIRDSLCPNYGKISNQWALRGGSEYNDEIKGYDYNPDKARELLMEAGYPDGFKTTINCQADDTYVDVCQIIVEQLSQVGIDVTLNAVETANYVNYIGEWDGMLMHPMGANNGQYSQLAANFRQGLTRGLGINAFIHPDDVNTCIVEGKSKTLENAVPDFAKAAKLVFDDYCMMKGAYLTLSAFVFDDSVKGIGTIPAVLNSNLLYKVWIDK